MATVIDYVLLRKDLTMLERSYNEIDFSTLALLSYIDFAPVVTMETPCQSLKQVYESMKERDQENKYMHLLGVMADSKRYSDILVMKYMSEKSEELVEQFAAVTFVLQDGRIVVSFRGTDHSIVGWKENFYMLYKESVACEQRAVLYLNEIHYEYNLKECLRSPYYGKNYLERLERYHQITKEIPITFVGHSKGGHIAIYCGAIFQKEVYNYDGPGMNILIDEYEKNKGRVHSYIPEYSLFGRMFEHLEPLQVVKSVNHAYMEHALFSWVVETDHFTAGEVNQDSLRALEGMFDFLKGLSNKDKEAFIDAMFTMFDQLGMKNVDDLKKVNYHKVFSSIDTFRKLDPKARNNMIQMISMLINEFR